MGTFLLIAVTVAVGSFLANALMTSVGRFNKRLLILTALVVAGAGAYAISFVSDMIVSAKAGELPVANIVWPCMTWSLIAFSLLAVTARRNVPFVVLAIPFWLLGGVAMLASQIHPRNLVTAFVLLLGGVAYGYVGGQQSARSDPHLPQNTGKVRRGHAPAIGAYRLDMNTDDLPHLVELTPEEKQALNARFAFEGERDYNAPPANFAGLTWNIMLGAVNNRVYKVSALFAEGAAAQRDSSWGNLNHLLRDQLGSPAHEEGNLIAWDTEDGNVVMNRAEAGNAYVVVLTLTSRAISGFRRK